MTDKTQEIRKSLEAVRMGKYPITAFADLEHWLSYLLTELDAAKRCKDCGNTGWVRTGVEHAGIAEMCPCDCDFGAVVSKHNKLATALRSELDAVKQEIEMCHSTINFNDQWIEQLIQERNAAKQENERLKQENQDLADKYNDSVYGLESLVESLQQRLKQAEEALETIHDKTDDEVTKYFALAAIRCIRGEAKDGESI